MAQIDLDQQPEAEVQPHHSGGRRFWERPIGTPLAAALSVLVSLFGLLFLAWAVLFVSKGRFLKGMFEDVVSASTHREVEVAGDFQFYFNPVALRFRAEGMRIANPGWAGEGDFFHAALIDADLATFSFLLGGGRVDRLLLEDAALDLQWDAAGKRNSWTFGDPDKKGDPLDIPLIRRARAAGTAVRYRDPHNRLSADIAVETVEASDDRFASAIRFTGTASARDSDFAVTGALLAPNATVAGGNNRLVLRLRGRDILGDITGTLRGATGLEGADLRGDVRGGNIANLFAILGVATPDTRRYRITSAFTKAGDEWRFTGLRGRFGASDIAGKLTVKLTRPRLLLTADLSTQTLDIVDVAPFIGYNPDKVAAQGNAGLVTSAGGAPRVLPDAPLRIEALSNFDADVQWKVRRVRAKSFPISNIALGVTLEDRLLNLSPFSFDMARGHVDADIAINARRSPVFTDYDIRLAPTPMGVLLSGFGVEESGTNGTMKARIQLTGTGNSVHDSLSTANGRIAMIIPKGSLWARNAQLSELDVGVFIQKMFEDRLKEPVEINCGLVGFTVRNGIGAADPILIDTSKNVILGRGGFSFRNESVDLAFRADGKRFSLFSGQSPVGINGYFARPGIDVISGDLLARAGAGLGLAVAASPLAAVIAFVDVGDAKAADCGPVLAGANAQAQRDERGRQRDDVGRGTTSKAEDGRQSDGEARQQRKKFLGIF